MAVLEADTTRRSGISNTAAYHMSLQENGKLKWLVFFLPQILTSGVGEEAEFNCLNPGTP
jgi:hypothetical protein